MHSYEFLQNDISQRAHCDLLQVPYCGSAGWTRSAVMVMDSVEETWWEKTWHILFLLGTFSGNGRLLTWKIPKICSTLTMLFCRGKIKEPRGRFSSKPGLPEVQWNWDWIIVITIPKVRICIRQKTDLSGWKCQRHGETCGEHISHI